jgi:hypothetical protein
MYLVYIRATLFGTCFFDWLADTLFMGTLINLLSVHVPLVRLAFGQYARQNQRRSLAKHYWRQML